MNKIQKALGRADYFLFNLRIELENIRRLNGEVPLAVKADEPILEQ